MELHELRSKIDAIDDQIIELLVQRMEVVQQVGKLKRTTGSTIYRPEREKSIVDRLEAKVAGRGNLNRQAIEAIYLEIFAISRNLELPERIAFLGPEGSFTHQAAESRFGALSEYISLTTIRSVFESVETGRVRFGVVPIENNQEGSVAETIDSLCEKNVKIVAEVPMSIHFTFASLQDRMQHINVIYSKDIAFRQCKNFIEEYFGDKVKLIEVTSTSKAAQLAAENPQSAAICSPIAAKLFRLPVLFENIEDSHHNTTRFLILAKDYINQPSKQDKTSILVRIPDKPGALVNFLREFKDRDINLTKIDSRPARIRDNFKYWFLIDFDGHFQDANVQEIFQKHSDIITFLGSYVKMC
ncbi:MAG: prephenate dehydratase [Flammeovirgaceae bacterium]|nr:prephenate dehydratase [Flammeovirgaceae bacterium]MDW8288559.1 prephenate dehydratase [Flammeovirgaceae bacterium]